MKFIDNIISKIKEERKETKILNEILNCRDKIYVYESRKEYLLRAYKELRDYNNLDVICIYWKGYSIPVPIEYLKDILAYSEGTCFNVVQHFKDKIQKLEQELRD